MRKIARTALTATAVMAGTLALTTAPASAAVTSVEIDPAGTNITINATNSGNVVGVNDRTGVALICTSLTASGTIPNSGPVGPNGIAQVNTVNFSGCTVLGNPATVTAQNLPWALNVTDVTSGGVTPGALVGVDVNIDVPALNCVGDANGPGSDPGVLPGNHTDRPSAGQPSQLTLPLPNPGNNIALENIDPNVCPSDIAANGDSVTVAGKLDILADVPPSGPTNDTGLTVLAT